MRFLTFLAPLFVSALFAQTAPTAEQLAQKLASTHDAWGAEETVVDFEKAVPLLSDGKANRVQRWEEKGAVFTLAHEPQQTKRKGMLMSFTHLSTGHKGILCAMATEPIPVRATFPRPVSSVSISFWGSTGTPALLEAFDSEGKVVDRASLESTPGRKTPGDPVPMFTMKHERDGPPLRRRRFLLTGPHLPTRRGPLDLQPSRAEIACSLLGRGDQ